MLSYRRVLIIPWTEHEQLRNIKGNGNRRVDICGTHNEKNGLRESDTRRTMGRASKLHNDLV